MWDSFVYEIIPQKGGAWICDDEGGGSLLETTLYKSDIMASHMADPADYILSFWLYSS